MLLNCGVGEDSWESLGLQGDSTSPSERKSVLNIHWKDWRWTESPIFQPPAVKSQFIRKDPDSGKDWRQEEKGMTEDEMVGWHHWLNGHESEQAPGDGDGQGGLVCCRPWGCKESDTTEWLNCSTLSYCFLLYCSSQLLCFLQIEHLWQPYLEQVYQHHFPTALGNKEKLKHECITAG